MRFKLIAFDLDGVLVKEPSAWWTLHRAFGTYRESGQNLRAYEAGEIDYPEFMRRDIALWGRRSLKEVEGILLRFTLAPKAQEVTDRLRSSGYELAIVSAGIDILARAVADRLQIRRWIANGLAVDPSGFLTGEGIYRVDLLDKTPALEGLIGPLAIARSEVVAVGDSKYDTQLMMACGTGVGIWNRAEGRPDPPWPTSCLIIKSLADLPDALDHN